jgi:hypothetical protein
MMSTYETWARQVLEICGDSRLEVRFEELFNKSASAIPLGTRIRGRWHKNNVSLVLLQACFEFLVSSF